MDDMEKTSNETEETVIEESTVVETVSEDVREEGNVSEDNAASVDSADQQPTAEATVTGDSDEETVPNDEAECAEIVRSVERQKGFISYLRDLVFGLTVVLLLFMLIFRVVVVSGPSMMDTLRDGDSLLLISNIFYRNPKYGDVIVASKDSFKDGEPIIKRVIATEGQTVDIDFEAGIVYVDGKALEEPYVRTATNLKEGVQFPLTVSEGCVFVMGDNRNDSLDSRSLQIGQIDRREILGRVLFLAFPGSDPNTRQRDFSRIGALD